MKGPYSPEITDGEWHRIDRAIKAMRESGGDLNVSYGSRDRCWSAYASNGYSSGCKSGGYSRQGTPTQAVRNAVWELVLYGHLEHNQGGRYFNSWKPPPIEVLAKLKEIGLDEPSDWEQFQINLEGTHL